MDTWDTGNLFGGHRVWDGIPAGRQYFQADDVNWWPGIWSVKTRRKPVLWFYCCCLVSKSCPILCNPLGFGVPGFPDLHYLLEFAQTHVHRVSDAIQSSHSPMPSSPPAFHLSQQQGLFQWISSSHQMAKVLECKKYCFLQHLKFLLQGEQPKGPQRVPPGYIRCGCGTQPSC